MKRNDEDLVILDYNNSTVHFYKVGADTDITEENNSCVTVIVK